MQYYSPFDDLFGLAALLKPSTNESLSASPSSEQSYWNEHERDRSSDSEGSVFGSDKDPSSPTGYLSGGLMLQLDSPTAFGRTSSPKEFDFTSAFNKVKPVEQGLNAPTRQNHNQRTHSVPISRTRQPFMTLTYEDFLKNLENMGPLISNSSHVTENHSISPILSSQHPPITTRFDPVSLLSGHRTSSLSMGSSAVSGEKKATASGAAATRYCVFCKNNGEEEYFYNNHVLKSDNGIIVCPVLRAYQCPICHASGDYAHTIKYCPLGKGNEHDWLNSRSNRTTSNRITAAVKG